MVSSSKGPSIAAMRILSIIARAVDSENFAALAIVDPQGTIQLRQHQTSFKTINTIGFHGYILYQIELWL